MPSNVLIRHVLARLRRERNFVQTVAGHPNPPKPVNVNVDIPDVEKSKE